MSNRHRLTAPLSLEDASTAKLKTPPPRYGRPAADDDEPTLTVTQAAHAAGVSPLTVRGICGGTWPLPALTDLDDGAAGWRGAADIASVEAWIARIRRTHTPPPVDRTRRTPRNAAGT